MPFSVVTYNVLADRFITPDRYPGVPAEHLEPARRRPRLVEQVAGLDADVLCLQEVEADAFAAFAQRLHSQGYSDLFLPKSATQPVGLAVFVRRSAFAVRNHLTLEYRDATADLPATGLSALILLLEKDGRSLYLATTHLRYDPPAVPDDRRRGLIEIRQLLAMRSKLADTPTWLIAGDLNATPQSPIIAALRAAGLDHAHRDREEIKTFYGDKRATLVDYLFHTPDLAATPHELPQYPEGTKLPSADQPSDHLPLQATFEWR